MRCLFLHPGHWTKTIPFSYDRFENSCVDRSLQFGTVHVNVMDRRGSTGSSGIFWDVVSPDEGEDAEDALEDDGAPEPEGSALEDWCRTAR